MDATLVDRLRAEMRYEFGRTAPPPGFPAFPDIPVGRHVGNEFWRLEEQYLWPRVWVLAGRAAQPDERAHDDEKGHEQSPWPLPDANQAREVDLQHHRIDHHPDQERDREVDPASLAELETTESVGRSGEDFPEQNAREHADRNPDRQVAFDMARMMVTQYLGQQPHIMKASGVPQALLDRVGEVLTWPATHEQVEAASKLVPDEVVQMLTASGTPAEARERVSHYVRNGCTCPILYPLGDVTATIDAFSGWEAH